MKKTLSFYTLFFIFCTALMRLSGLLSKMILAKSITPYEYGLITLIAISLPSMFQVLTNLFFNDLLSHSTRGSKYFGFTMLYSAGISFILAALVLIFHREFFSFMNVPLDDWRYLFLALFIVVIPSAFMVNMLGLLRGHRNYNLTSSVLAAPSILRVMLLGIAVYFFSVRDFNSILMLFAAPMLLVTVFVCVKEWRKLAKRMKDAASPPKDMMLFGLTIFIVGVYNGLTQSIAKVVISHDLGVEMQGYFDVSFSVLTLLAFSFTAMQFIAVPEATGRRDKKELLYKKGELGDVLRALFALLIFCIIVLCFYSHSIIELLFSAAYTKAADYMYILALAHIFLFVQQALAYVNISTGRDTRELRNMFIITVAALLIFPFAAHYMILSTGFKGAYIASAAFLVLYSLATICFSRDRSPIKALLQKGERLFVSSAAASALIFFLEPDMIPGIVLSGLVYVLLIFSSGYLHKDIVLDAFKTKKADDSGQDRSKPVI